MVNRSARIFAGLLTALSGCSVSTSPESAADVPQGNSFQRHMFGAFEYVLPDGWTKENAAGGLLLMAPDIENNWQANLFLEFLEDPDGRTLEQALAELIPNLKDRKNQFHELSRKSEKHSGGFQMCSLKYTCVDQETPLTEWEIVIEADGKKRLFVLASSASASWAKYLPVLERFVGSLRKRGD